MLALIGAGVFFVGILLVWSWMIGAIVERQRAYDRTRVNATTPEPGRAGEPLDISPRRLSVWGD